LTLLKELDPIRFLNRLCDKNAAAAYEDNKSEGRLHRLTRLISN
jgi:hypothetical protein